MGPYGLQRSAVSAEAVSASRVLFSWKQDAYPRSTYDSSVAGTAAGDAPGGVSLRS